MSFAQRQRSALLSLMQELGPHAPTKCEGWDTQDLAAHLHIRERRLDALPGIGSERFADRTERIQMETLHSKGYPALLEELHRPGWIMRPLDKLVNTSEFFIHHEDVLRANGRSQTLTPAEQQELWPIVKVLARKAQVAYKGRVVLTRTDKAAEVPMGQGDRPVRVSGLPSELLLYFSGRDADVTVSAEPDAEAAWRKAIGAL
ncbi:MAG TPA: TIGR03085 family protein [Tessaracoccus flavescens]|uniref:TIGR03085 family protein n=1 Tax=Tessaracoccus flavescens TaxID=399497 RepID=A0A921JR69_9ACTN|nr:TIGR03085 family protein [Tessaracoccus flavescens]